MNVAFRVDASGQIGLGHFMRCVCLADGLRRRGAAIRFVSEQLPAHLQQMLADRTYEVALIDETSGDDRARDAQETASALAARAWDWLVVDHYGLDARWESALRGHANRILVIDDLADRPHDCDVLLDQNLHPDTVVGAVDTVVGAGDTVVGAADTVVGAADTVVGAADTVVGAADTVVGAADTVVGAADTVVGAADTVVGAADTVVGAGFSRLMDRYAGKVPPACQLLLGPRYALLREEFQRARATLRRRSAPVTSVLVSFGGADVENRTGVAIEALLALGAPIPAVDVLIGACHAHRSEIESACRRHGFRCHVQSSQVADLMAAADLAIGAGGSTTWERCCMGLPALVVPIAANQRGVVEAAALQGLVYTPAGGDVTAASLALHLKALLDNPRLLEMMSRNGMQAVDGRGADRVVRALDHDSIRIREATLDDAHALFEWRNHESIRAVSRRPDPIAWPEHQAWLRSVLADDDRLLLIGERDGVPVGVVRFDVSCHDADVSIYRVPGSAESGVGSSLLAAAETWLNARRPDLESLTADVLGENDRSHHLFRSTGYELHSAQYRKRLHLS